MTPPGRSPARAALPLALALTAVTVLPACSSPAADGIATAGGAAPASAAPATPAGNPAERARQWARCLRDHGLAVPDADAEGKVRAQESGAIPKPPGGVERALAACRQYAPPGSAKSRTDPTSLAALRRYAQCMRREGIASFPDPQPDDAGIKLEKGRPGSELDPRSPRFQAAQQACKPLLRRSPGADQ